MATLYPSGYAGAMRTMEQMASLTTVQRLHPEVWRRMSALMVEAAEHGVQLGVGTGWRKQPSDGRPGFAAPGNSYHEGFMPGGTTRPDGVNDRNAMAIDTVLTSAWPWMNGNCGRFGFVHFASVNNEPWHIQPVEIPRSRNFATAQPPLQTWPLPQEGLIVTGDDIKILQAMEARIIAAVNVVDSQVAAIPVPTPWAGTGQTRPLVTALHYVLRNTSAVYLGERLSGSTTENPNAFWPDEVSADLAALKDAVAGVDTDALIAAVTNAVTAALADVTINADVSTEDIAKIAAASAAAVIAEIAS